MSISLLNSSCFRAKESTVTSISASISLPISTSSHAAIFSPFILSIFRSYSPATLWSPSTLAIWKPISFLFKATIAISVIPALSHPPILLSWSNTPSISLQSAFSSLLPSAS
jgi:hypothetical protein